MYKRQVYPRQHTVYPKLVDRTPNFQTPCGAEFRFDFLSADLWHPASGDPIAPVSYTHLDVYKRQVCSCSEKCEAGAVNTDCAVCSVNMSKCVGVEPEPEPTETQEPAPEEAEPETGSNTGMLLEMCIRDSIQPVHAPL